MKNIAADSGYQNLQTQNKNVSLESQRSKPLVDNIYDVDSNSEDDSNNDKILTKKTRRSRAYTQSNIENDKTDKKKLDTKK